jgi:hypothetical protein
LLSNRPPMQPFCVNTVSPLSMLYLLRLVLRQLSRVVCRCSRLAGWLAGWLAGGHLFLLACGCLVAQRCHARRLDPVQSFSRSDHPQSMLSTWTFPLSARHLHANSLPACLPAFALPTATTTMRAECHARPLQASREASCVVPCTLRPPFVPVC